MLFETCFTLDGLLYLHSICWRCGIHRQFFSVQQSEVTYQYNSVHAMFNKQGTTAVSYTRWQVIPYTQYYHLVWDTGHHGHEILSSDKSSAFSCWYRACKSPSEENCANLFFFPTCNANPSYFELIFKLEAWVKWQIILDWNLRYFT